MKVSQCKCVAFLLFCLTLIITCAVHGQQTQTNPKFFEETKLKAEKGDAIAQYFLGVMYREGKRVEKNHANAEKWFRKAAEQNDENAQHDLGVMYANGEGVDRDFFEALKWYRKAAAQNHAQAQFQIANMYVEGFTVEMDFFEAMKWYRKAAEQNHAQAQFRLARMYEAGVGDGIGRDYAEAMKWLRKAAEQNDADAQYALGMVYYNGVVKGEKDFVEAYAWWNLAANESRKAADELDELEPRMGQAQVLEAQKRSKELRAIIEAKIAAQKNESKKR